MPYGPHAAGSGVTPGGAPSGNDPAGGGGCGTLGGRGGATACVPISWPATVVAPASPTRVVVDSAPAAPCVSRSSRSSACDGDRHIAGAPPPGPASTPPAGES